MTVTDPASLIAAILGPPTAVGKDAATAKQAGVPHTPWYGTGLIGAGAAPTGGLNGATFTGASGLYTGGIPMPAGVTGKTTVIERLSLVHAGNVGVVWVVDKLWGNVPVVTTTTGQAVTSPAWPARDTVAGTNGVGVYLALEISATTGNAGAITNTTVTYTNSAGTAGRTATIPSVPAGPVTGTFIPFSLQAGDGGVRSVQTVTLGTSYVSGTLHIVAFRYVTELPVPNVNVGNRANFMDLGMPTVWDNSVLQLVYWPTGTAVGALAGSLTYAQG